MGEFPCPPADELLNHRVALIQSSARMSPYDCCVCLSDHNRTYWHFYGFGRPPQSFGKLIGQCVGGGGFKCTANWVPSDHIWSAGADGCANKFALAEKPNKVHPDINWKLKSTLLAASTSISLRMTRKCWKQCTNCTLLWALATAGPGVYLDMHRTPRRDVPECIRHCLSNTCLLHELFASNRDCVLRRWGIRVSLLPLNLIKSYLVSNIQEHARRAPDVRVIKRT